MNNYIIICEHREDDKDCKHKEACAKHCHNNKTNQCNIHCDGRSWKCATEAQANTLKQTHMANETLHKPVIKKV